MNNYYLLRPLLCVVSREPPKTSKTLLGNLFVIKIGKRKLGRGVGVGKGDDKNVFHSHKPFVST